VLAYVFSHRPAPGVEAARYEAVLGEFHSRLAATPPRGFISSLTYRIGDAYSDWYLLVDSAAMDALNEAAVSGSRTTPHNIAARMAVDGVGKLLSLATGEQDAAAGCEIRFAKPPGMAYADLYASLEFATATRGAGLWRRMMVLGPPPEFCLTTSTPVELPPAMRPEVLNRSRI
jgi:hypothetical protein